MCTNEKYKLNWTKQAKKSSCVSARMKFPHQVTIDVGGLACQIGIR